MPLLTMGGGGGEVGEAGAEFNAGWNVEFMTFNVAHRRR